MTKSAVFCEFNTTFQIDFTDSTNNSRLNYSVAHRIFCLVFSLFSFSCLICATEEADVQLHNES